MAPRPEQAIDAEGTLRLDTPSGQSLDLVADRKILHLEAPRWADARTSLPRSFNGRRRALRSAANLLANHGLTLSVESAGKPVLLLGYDVAPSWFARLLGLAPAHIPVSAIRLLFRR